MLMRTDPFRELDRLTQQVFGHLGAGSRPAVAPMEAYRQGDEFVVHFDLPGVDPASIDLSVERDVLTMKAERRPTMPDNIESDYDAGVLTLRIPVLEQAKPRRIEIGGGSRQALTS